MRIYFHPAFNQLISTVILLASITLAGFLGFKALTTFQSDPSLQQIPEIMQGR